MKKPRRYTIVTNEYERIAVTGTPVRYKFAPEFEFFVHPAHKRDGFTVSEVRSGAAVLQAPRSTKIGAIVASGHVLRARGRVELRKAVEGWERRAS